MTFTTESIVNGRSASGNEIKIKISSFEEIEKRIHLVFDEHFPDLTSKMRNFNKAAKSQASDFLSRNNINRNANYPSKSESRFYDSKGNFLQYTYQAAHNTAYSEAYKTLNAAKSSYIKLLNEISDINNVNIKNANDNLTEFEESIDKIRIAMDTLESVSCDFMERVDTFRKFYSMKGTYNNSTNNSGVVRKGAKFSSQGSRAIEASSSDTPNEPYISSSSSSRSILKDRILSEDSELTKELTTEFNEKVVGETGATISDNTEIGGFTQNANETVEQFNIRRYQEYTGKEWESVSKEVKISDYYASSSADSDELLSMFPSLPGGDATNSGASMKGDLAGSIASSGSESYQTTYSGEMPDNVRGEWEKDYLLGVVGGNKEPAAKGIFAPPKGDTGDVLGATSYTSSPNVVLPGTMEGELPKGVKPIVNTDIPEKLSNNSRYIDDEAKEIYYSRSPEMLSAERANALSAVDTAFEGEDTEFKNILSQCYEDADIDIIMKNKELAVTAFILATESKSLTDIANKLAKSQGVQDFDTAYDDKLSRYSLENGLSQSKLMAELSDDVVAVRNEVQAARAKYNSTVKKANDSIEDAKRKKADMEALRNGLFQKYGNDTSKWTQEEIDTYNASVESYNIANRTANANHDEALIDRQALEQATAKLNETQSSVTNSYFNTNGYNAAPMEQQVIVNSQNVSNVDEEFVGTGNDIVTSPVDNGLVIENGVVVEPQPQVVQEQVVEPQPEPVNKPSVSLSSEDIMSLFGRPNEPNNVNNDMDALNLSVLDNRELSNGINNLAGNESSKFVSPDEAPMSSESRMVELSSGPMGSDYQDSMNNYKSIPDNLNAISTSEDDDDESKNGRRLNDINE